MKESDYIDAITYQQDYGLLTAFVNSDKKRWKPVVIEINVKRKNDPVYVGMKRNELIDVFGTDYSVNTNKIYYEYVATDVYFYFNYEFTIESDTVKSIYMELFYP